MSYSNHRFRRAEGKEMNKNHWGLNWSPFCQRRFSVQLHFQKAENVLEGSSANPNEPGLPKQNQNNLVFPFPPLLRDLSPSELRVLVLLWTLQRLSVPPLRVEMSPRKSRAFQIQADVGPPFFNLYFFLAALYLLHQQYSVKCHYVRLPLGGDAMPDSCLIKQHWNGEVCRG